MELSNVTDAEKLHMQLKTLISLISSEIVDAPSLTNILYSGLDSDDPEKILKAQTVTRVNTFSIIPYRPATIKGVWFDSLSLQSSRLRSIYSSNSEMFLMSIDRNSSTPQSFYFNSEDYICTGIVKFDAAQRTFKGYFIDSTQVMYRTYKTGAESVKIPFNTGSSFFYSETIRNDAIQLFFSKKSNDNVSMMNTNLIPSNLQIKIIQEVAQEMNIAI